MRPPRLSTGRAGAFGYAARARHRVRALPAAHCGARSALGPGGEPPVPEGRKKPPVPPPPPLTWRPGPASERRVRGSVLLLVVVVALTPRSVGGTPDSPGRIEPPSPEAKRPLGLCFSNFTPPHTPLPAPPSSSGALGDDRGGPGSLSRSPPVRSRPGWSLDAGRGGGGVTGSCHRVGACGRRGGF